MDKEFMESELWLKRHQQLGEMLRKWQDEHPNATSEEFEKYKQRLLELFDT